MPKVFAAFFFLLVMTNVVFAQRTPSETDPLRFLFTAEDLAGSNHYSAAARSFQDFLDAGAFQLNAPGYHQKAEASYGKAFAGLALFHPDGAAGIEKFTQDFPEHSKAREAYYNAGLFFYNQKQYKAAIPYFKKASASGLPDDKMYESVFKLGYS